MVDASTDLLQESFAVVDRVIVHVLTVVVRTAVTRKDSHYFGILSKESNDFFDEALSEVRFETRVPFVYLQDKINELVALVTVEDTCILGNGFHLVELLFQL